MGPEPLISAQTTTATVQLNTYNDDHCAIWANGLAGAETVTISFATETGGVSIPVPDPSLTTTFTLTATVPACVLDGGYLYVITKSVTVGAATVGVAHKRLSA